MGLHGRRLSDPPSQDAWVQVIVLMVMKLTGSFLFSKSDKMRLNNCITHLNIFFSEIRFCYHKSLGFYVTEKSCKPLLHEVKLGAKNQEKTSSNDSNFEGKDFQ